MGRLFWKFFLAFWLSLVAAGLATALVLFAYLGASRPPGELASGPRAELALNVASAALALGGAEGLRDLLTEFGKSSPVLGEFYVLDETGADLLGRSPPEESVARARALVRAREGIVESGRPGSSWSETARLVTDAQGRSLLLFMAEGPTQSRFAPPPPPALRGGRAMPWLPIVSGLLASLLASAFLARRFSKPIRALRWAFKEVGAGRLDARVSPRMANSRSLFVGGQDEIGDLGRAFDRMAEDVERLVASHKRLLHDVSHELRAPLARLQAAIGLARQTPERAEAALDRVERESERLDALVGEILTLARLESGAPRRERVRFDLADVLADAAEDADFEAEASDREVRLTLNADCESGGCSLEGDPETLRRALDNVLRNAVRFSPPGCAVEAALVRLSPGEALIRICDQGPGVPPEELEAIFAPFHRCASQAANGPADARSRDGFGLGLAIARRAVEAHGGTLRALCRTPSGFCIEARIPLT